MEKVLRITEGMCHECLELVPARLVREADRIYLIKECPKHGQFKVLISPNGDYFEELDRFYFDLIQESYKQRDFIIRLTDRCNLNCTICLASANERPTPDFSLEELRKFLKGKKRVKVDLMGAEPTVRDDLIDIIRLVSETKNFPALHTNGIKLAEEEYVKELAEAGLTEVHLQFDGFDDNNYQRIRGEELLEIKMKALENLKKYNISTDLVVTIVRNDNEKEIKKVLDYAIGNNFIKEVFYLGCRFLGKATNLSEENCLMPDEVMDEFLKQMNGEVTRRDMLIFQKLYFSFLHFFKVRKCLYIHHYLFFRRKDGTAVPFNKLINMERLNKKLERYRKLVKKSPFLARLYLLPAIGLCFLNPRALSVLKDSLIIKLLLYFGFDLSKVTQNSILIGFITACDPLIFDIQVAKNCGKGEISNDLGYHNSGAWANVLRDKSFLKESSTNKI